MANEKISQLPSGAPAQTTDQAIVARSGANYRLNLSDIIALFASAIPFSALISGVNTAAAMTVGSGAVLSASGSGEILATNVEAVVASSITTLGSPVSVSGLTTVLTKAVTMPSTGGPFRVFVSYGYYVNAGTHGLVQTYVSDGSVPMATSQLNIYNDGNTDGGQASSFSPGTYANGESVTFSLLINASTAGSVTVENANAGPVGQATWLQVTIVPSD